MPVSNFPNLPGLSYPIKRSPQFTTTRYEAMSGRRTVSPKQAFPRWRWALPFSFLRSAAYGIVGTYAELEQLTAFFNICSAGGLTFAYTDEEDNTATAQPFGSGDGVTTEFQLYRSMGGFTEPVYLGTPTEVTIAGVPTVDYTVGETGVVSFLAAPADGAQLAWTGTFKWLCRFDDDSLDLQSFLRGAHEVNSPVAFSNELFP